MYPPAGTLLEVFQDRLQELESKAGAMTTQPQLQEAIDVLRSELSGKLSSSLEQQQGATRAGGAAELQALREELTAAAQAMVAGLAGAEEGARKQLQVTEQGNN